MTAGGGVTAARESSCGCSGKETCDPGKVHPASSTCLSVTGKRFFAKSAVILGLKLITVQ